MDKKIAFIHIPKAAGGSLRKWAKDNKNKNFSYIGHISLPEYIKNNPNLVYYKSFTITRNTYTRMLSLYNFAKSKHLKMLKQVKTGNKRRLSTNDVKTINNELDAWEKGIVYYLDYILEYRFDFHDQLKYIQDVDIVIPYENLKNDFYIIQDLTKCYSPLVQSVHTYKTKAVTNMSKQYLDCINKHFEKEIDFFQYTP